MSGHLKVQTAKAALAIVPSIDEAKARLFEEFQPGEFFPGHGYVTFKRVAIAVDEVTYDTVAYYDCILRGKDSSYSPTVMNYRYRIEEGVFKREHLHTVLSRLQVTTRKPLNIKF